MKTRESYHGKAYDTQNNHSYIISTTPLKNCKLFVHTRNNLCSSIGGSEALRLSWL